MSAASSTNPQQTPHVPHHTVARAIGRGSYGEIWLARSLTGAWRAVKIVERKRFEDTRAFEREFEGMAQFEPLSREHPGFVDILHVGRSDDDAFFYYVMELADDVVARQVFESANYQPKTLKSEMQRVARMQCEEVVQLGLSLTTALAALHRHDLVHRDIKPANIIFCGGIPKIADIGLVSAMGQNSFVGTEGYVPPEGPGTLQADLYSLGKVLYEVAMGKDRLDFPALDTRMDERSDRNMLMRLNEVLLRACNFDARQRYADADEMHEDLERVRDGRPLLRSPRQKRRVLPMAALLMAGGGALAWWQFGPTPPLGGKGSVFLETDPPGVKVRIESFEGRFVETPAHIPDLPAGEHVGHVISPLYDRVDFKFSVAPGEETHPPKLQLKRSHGSARIESTPPDCEFELYEGTTLVKSGRTPATLADLPTGKYEVLMRHRGREKRAPLEIERTGTETPAPLRIEFVSRAIAVTSSIPVEHDGHYLLEPAPGVEIFADGQPAGTTPCTVSLMDGSHKLTARYKKWPEVTREITEETTAGVAFAFPLGSVKLISKPFGAEIFKGETRIGETPLLIEDLEPGDVSYTLKLAGYQPAVVTAKIEPGKQVSATWRFESRPAPRKGEPWENSLGMKFSPVGDILVGTWAVRVSDYTTFCTEEGRPRVIVDFQQEDTHPAVRVNWEDATAFCEWLTRRELAAGKLEEGQVYRLPTDAEWSAAAGMPPEGGATPEQRDGLIRDLPWGKAWPPPAGAGNFADTTYKRGSYGATRGIIIEKYTDGFAQTAPVGSFAPNKFGLYDMSGNVWQWVAESYNGGAQRKDWGVLRGGSWGTNKQEELRLGYRFAVDRGERDVLFGFRCVLVPEP